MASSSSSSSSSKKERRLTGSQEDEARRLSTKLQERSTDIKRFKQLANPKPSEGVEKNIKNVSTSENELVNALLDDVLTSLGNLAPPQSPSTVTSLAVESKEPRAGTAGVVGGVAPVESPLNRAKTIFTHHIAGTPGSAKKKLDIETFDKSVQADFFAPVVEEEQAGTLLRVGIKGDRRRPAVLQETQKKVEGSQEKTEEEKITPAATEAPPPPKPLSADEERRVLKSSTFREFFQNTTKIVERALGATQLCDIIVDYSGVETASSETGGIELKNVCTYSDGKLCPGRAITDLRASQKFSELFLAAYGTPDLMSPKDPDGCVLVWSVPMTDRPEYVFTCPSAVCTAMFDQFSPHIIIGGSYTGALLLWDTRARSKPVQRTPLCGRGHSHPIYSMELAGTQHAHNLISVCTDGKLCVWSLSMLVNPTESISLKRGTREVSVGCIAMTEGETNILYGGAEDGAVFQAHIHGSRVGLTAEFAGHGGPVTNTEFHPAGKDLLLSSSFDWSVKLWSPRSFQSPLCTFEVSEDYIYDVKWHPHHPSIFATCNGEGVIDLWNLNSDFELAAFTKKASPRAINQICWSTDGRRLMSADGQGNVELWAASQEVYQPRGDDMSKFEARIEELKPDSPTVGGEVSAGLAR